MNEVLRAFMERRLGHLNPQILNLTDNLSRLRERVTLEESELERMTAERDAIREALDAEKVSA